jgi:phage tail-like protein
MSRHSHAPWLPLTSAPPHDPRRLPLNRRAGWHLAQSENVEEDACGSLSLALKAGSQRVLFEASGSLGGLRLPHHLAYAQDFGVVLLDRKAAQLKVFDPCTCRFNTVPCTGGIGKGAREFNDPHAPLICGDKLLVADTGNKRLVVYSLFGFLVRGFWTLPVQAQMQPWQPVCLALSADRKILVGDPANGAVHVFNGAGIWLKSLTGLGAVSALGVDTRNRLYVVSDPLTPVRVLQLPAGNELPTTETTVTELTEHFAAPPFNVDAQGNVDLGWLCARYQGTGTGPSRWFDATGTLLANYVPAAPQYENSGHAFTSALDSHLYRCQWHRIALDATVPHGTRLLVSTFSAETELTTGQLAALTPEQWQTRQTLFPDEKNPARVLDWDCLVRSEPGRYLWLRLELRGDGSTTPRLCNVELEFPRISLARYLPAVFSEEPQAADFSDRFLAIFDRGFRQVEQRIDTLAALFDPLSAPAEAGRKDFLSWLASWIGVTLDRQLPLSLRRRLVKQAARLYERRGTVGGLRGMLDLYLGIDGRACAQQSDCRPCGAPEFPAWEPPKLILEHFVLRRWLFLGVGRLGEQAQLWGQKIVNRSQLLGPGVDGNAQLGVTQLNSRPDPLRDPFHVYAHQFSVFLPAWVGRVDTYRNAVARLVAAEKPAHTQHQVVYVEPRFRVGIQSMIGYDAVIGCYPRGITLDSSKLGKATVLTGQAPRDLQRIG